MYEGIVAAADFLGSETSQPKRVRSLQIPGGDPTLSAYANYQGPQLAKVAICNLDLWDSSVSRGPRPQKQIKIQVPAGVTKVAVQRLTGPGAFALGQVTWGGQSFTGEDDGNGAQDIQIVLVQQGQVTVDVKATEAIVVSLQR